MLLTDIAHSANRTTSRLPPLAAALLVVLTICLASACVVSVYIQSEAKDDYSESEFQLAYQRRENADLLNRVNAILQSIYNLTQTVHEYANKTSEIKPIVSQVSQSIVVLNATLRGWEANITKQEVKNRPYIWGNVGAVAGIAAVSIPLINDVLERNERAKKLQAMERYFKLSRDYVLNSMVTDAAFCPWNYKTLYVSEKPSELDPELLRQSILGHERTVTSIVTSTNRTIALFLEQAWRQGEYISDPNAFTVAVSSATKCAIIPSKTRYAARLSDETPIMFGDHEMTLFANGTGRAVAGGTFDCGGMSYFTEETFVVSRVMVQEVIHSEKC
ncbi:MAG: hypothetical protein P4M11_10115 [Candidatus Pacebacteria bacterium]|nr:hypothetical protein [Candidatus Paceibacterota bacterium]